MDGNGTRLHSAVGKRVWDIWLELTFLLHQNSFYTFKCMFSMCYSCETKNDDDVMSDGEKMIDLLYMLTPSFTSKLIFSFSIRH